jgi:hypothetical protein
MSGSAATEKHACRRLKTPRVGVEPLWRIDTIIGRLLLPRNSKTEKNNKNAEPRYTAGTRNNYGIPQTNKTAYSKE